MIVKWWPFRIAYGLFFLHTALAKGELDERGRKGMHRFATSAYPFLERVPPDRLVQGMRCAEWAVAGSLLAPPVPAVVGAAGLAGYGAALTGLYLRAPGLRRPGSLRPTEIGMSVAKDTWMLAAGIAALTSRGRARP